MLSRLSIKNYALIDNLEIEFASGLNLMTGETGAGKSIILGALALILGQRADGKYFYNQDKKCIIEGYFTIGHYGLAGFFSEQDLDYEEETILRREISADGKSRAFVNDTPVTLQVLKALGEKLIDIHSQHATLAIGSPAFQLLVLDSAGRNQEQLAAYQSGFSAFKDTDNRLRQLKEQVEQAKTEADYQQYLLNELESANIQSEEDQALEEEQAQLTHAEEIKRSLSGAAYLLNEQEPNAVALIREALVHTQQAEKYLPALAEITVRLNSSFIELKDIADELAHTEQNTQLNEARLAEVNERLTLLYSLQQKHRVQTAAELTAIREELARRLDSLSVDEEEIAALEQQSNRLKASCISQAAELSKARAAVIPDIEKHIQDVLAETGMPGSRLQILLEPLAGNALQPHGGDQVQFLFSANKGQTPQPVGKVASGGELSRLMLAVKSLIARTTALPTIIFDEIDTGISGEVAVKVGRIMEQLAAHLQVIAITHLPQIAARGNTHFRVYKEERGGRTTTNIGLLAPEERVTEIAQMLSGSNPGETALKHAQELLNG